MFSNAIGGVHAWEISIEDFNRYMLVRRYFCSNGVDWDAEILTNTLSGCVHRCSYLCPLRLVREVITPRLLPPHLSRKMVPDSDLDYYFYYLRIHDGYRPGIDLCLSADSSNVGCHHYRGLLPQSSQPIHRNSSFQHCK